MSEGLSAASAEERVAAIEALRFIHLKDPEVLRKVLDLCADDTPAREAASDDPFAAFFQGEAATEVRTVGDEAVARLDRAGLPRGAWEALADAVTRHPDARRLHEAAARWAAETRWVDEIAALDALVPPLQAVDVPLLAVVASASEEGREVLIRRALRPWNPRTFQELLNHQASHAATLAALEHAIDSGDLVPDAPQALLILGLLAGWESEAAPRLARQLSTDHPWTVAYGSLDDPEQLPALLRWLDDGAPSAPGPLGWRLVEVLRQRPRIDGWPLARWVRRFDLPSEAFAEWGVDDAAAELLTGRLSKLSSTDEAERIEGWNAAGLLVAEDRHADALDALADAVAADLPWDADFLSRLASGRPPIPGLSAAIVAGIDRHDDPGPALAAAADLDREELEPVGDALLAWASAQPVATTPAGKGLVKESRDGVDHRALRLLVERAPSPERLTTLEAIEPVVRGRE